MKTESLYNEMILSMFTRELESVIDFPEKAGVVIDCAKDKLFYEVAEQLIDLLDAKHGAGTYKGYLNGEYDHTPEYKAAQPSSLFEAMGAITRPTSIDSLMGQIEMMREEQEIKAAKQRGLVDDTQSGNEEAEENSIEELIELTEVHLAENNVVILVEPLDAVIATSPLRYPASKAIEEKIQEEKEALDRKFDEAHQWNRESIERLNGSRRKAV